MHTVGLHKASIWIYNKRQLWVIPRPWEGVGCSKTRTKIVGGPCFRSAGETRQSKELKNKEKKYAQMSEELRKTTYF